MIKRTLQIALFISLLPVALSSFAQIERYVAGTHYTELPNPVNTRDAAKVEVLEAFWYGCSHCFRFEPLLTAWEESAPEDVDVVRFPALWNNLMKIHAQVYYTAEALDKLDVLHTPVTLLAGLGELSRIGEVILNPFIGPRLKTVVLTTDFPLVPDKMVDFGLQYFCSNCWKCARECPCDSISWGDKVIQPVRPH